MKIKFIDKIKKNNIKYKRKNIPYFTINIKNFLYDDSFLDYYSVFVDFGEGVFNLGCPFYFHEYDFEVKGDLVLSMVNCILGQVLSKCKELGFIKDYDLYSSTTCC